MKVLKTICAGDKGSHRFLAEWGSKLLNVRYRYEPVRNVILTTLEIVVDERPKVKSGQQQYSYLAARNRTTVGIIVQYHERTLREKVKSLGARWDNN